MPRLTRPDLEDRILDFLHSFYMDTGIPPTYREIAIHVGSAHSNVWQAVRDLRKGGFLRETSSSSIARSLLLSGPGLQRVLDRTSAHAIHTVVGPGVSSSSPIGGETKL